MAGKGGWQSGDHGPWGRPPSSGGGGPPRPGGDAPPPPDFDEWFKKSQDRLRQMFGGGKDHGSKGLALAAAVIFVLWLASGIYFVKADEQGVVLRFGHYDRTTAPGLNYHLPYPIESAEVPRVTAINRVEVGYRSGGAVRAVRGGEQPSIAEESLMLTGDENIVDVNFEVQWKISDAPDYLFNVRNPEQTVKSVAESAMREVIGRRAIATVLTTLPEPEGGTVPVPVSEDATNPASLPADTRHNNRVQIEQETRKVIHDTLKAYNAGIEVVAVNLGKAAPPSQVIDAFRDVQTAKADMQTERNKAETYRNDILPKARGGAQQMVLEAEGYKQEVIARSQGEASRFSAVYNEYKVARDVTKKRMYLETMEEILTGMTKLIIEGKPGSNGVVPYLPLPELKARAEEDK